MRRVASYGFLLRFVMVLFFKSTNFVETTWLWTMLTATWQVVPKRGLLASRHIAPRGRQPRSWSSCAYVCQVQRRCHNNWRMSETSDVGVFHQTPATRDESLVSPTSIYRRDAAFRYRLQSISVVSLNKVSFSLPAIQVGPLRVNTIN